MPIGFLGKRARRSRSRKPANFQPTILLLDERILLSVAIQVNAAASQHAISPLIYGLNNADAATLTYLNVPLNRSGGNLSSTYNWQQDAANHDFDYFYESIANGDGPPAQSSDQFISSTQGAGAQPIVTIPTMPYVAKLGPDRSILASYSVAKYGPQKQTDPFDSDAGNGILANGTPITGNDPNDAYVPNSVAFEQPWVQKMVAEFGTASNGGVQHFALDNEPSIWFGTHGDIAPTGVTMDQVLNYMIAYGSMIKSVDPTAQVQGPEEWGYLGTIYSGFDQQYGNANGYSNLPDQTAHGGIDYFPYLLQQLDAYQQKTGVRILDTLTVHDYPQGGEFSENDSTTMDQLRNVSTRSLWDPTYVDQSWINTQVDMIPRLQNWVSTYYPGTNIGITEYNWGDTQYMNGATSEADVLGIFGQQGLYMANLWPLENYPSTASEYPAYNAIKLYRNYDGHDSTFGDTSVSTAVPNPDQVSAFSAVRSSDGALTIVVDNKNLYNSSNPNATTTVQINIANFASNGAAQEWQLAAVNPNNMSVSAITRLTDVKLNGNILTVTVPQESVTLFVIEPAVQKELPTILMIAPLTASPGSSIVVTGTNFTGTTSVAFASAGTSVPAASFTVNSATQITVTVPSQGALPGTVDVIVTTSQGTSAQTAADKFTFGQSQENPGQFDFASSTQLAQETDTITNIQITRSGGSDGTVNVSFATSDGTGQAALDYVAASGTITFAPGQLSQTISVTILDSGKSNGTSTFAVTLSDPTGGATLGGTNVLTVTIEDSLPGEPVPQNLGPVAFFLAHSQEAYQYFVRQAYRQFLNRQPDAEGIAYWVLQMQQGLTDEHLEAGFAASPEFFAVNGGTDAGLVAGMYKDLLLRNPDQAGIDYWVAQLQGGASVASVAFGFTASAERESIRITDDYMTYLGRQPDPAGLTFWLNDFLIGGTNEDLIAGFVGSTEYYATPNKGAGNRAAWIAIAYQDVLHRVAKPSDIDYWESVLE